MKTYINVAKGLDFFSTGSLSPLNIFLNIAWMASHTESHTATSWRTSVSYLFFDRSQKVGGVGSTGGGATAAVSPAFRWESEVTRCLSDPHAPFSVSVSFLHCLHLAALDLAVQCRSSACSGAPPPTLQKYYKKVRKRKMKIWSWVWHQMSLFESHIVITSYHLGTFVKSLIRCKSISLIPGTFPVHLFKYL